MEFLVLPGTTKGAENFRATVRAALSTRYTGWDDDYDRQFDQNTIWFGLRNDGKYVATCKLIFKSYKGKIIKLPVERGDVASFTVPEPFDGVCEGSGLSLMGIKYFLTLMYGMGRWMVQNHVGVLYSIVDSRNERLKKLYQQVGFELLSNQSVSFSSFCYQRNCQPVIWQVICLRPEYFHSELNYASLEKLGASII